MSYAKLPFQRVTYTCGPCGARQKIPLRRIHFFERFHELDSGQPVLIRCPVCWDGVQMPSPYRTRTGHRVEIDPENVPKNAVLHQHH